MLLIENAFRLGAITLELFRAYMGTGSGDLATHAKDQAQDNRQTLQTEWDCPLTDPLSQDENHTAIVCLEKTDLQNNQYLEISVKQPADLTGPSTTFAKISGSDINGETWGIFHFQPSPGSGFNADLVCAVVGEISNPVTSAGAFSSSNVLFDNLLTSASCYVNFRETRTLTMAGQNGELHQVNIRPPDGGETAIVRYRENTQGQIFVIFGEGVNEIVVPLSNVIRAARQNDTAENGDRATVYLYSPMDDPVNYGLSGGSISYPYLTIPTTAIDRFPLTYPPADEVSPFPATQSELQPSSPQPDIPMQIESILSAESAVAEPRLPGSHTISYDFLCEDNENLSILQVDPQNQDAIALYMALTQPGWDPATILTLINNLQSHTTGFTQFKDNLPSWIKSIIGHDQYPYPPKVLSCQAGTIEKSFKLLSEIIHPNDTSTITGLDESGKLLIFTIANKLGSQTLTPSSHVNGIPDPAMNEQLLHMRQLYGLDHTVDHQTPKHASVALPYLPNLPSHPGLESLVHYGNLNPTTLPGNLITANGTIYPVDIPSGVPLRQLGTHLVTTQTITGMQESYIGTFAINPLDFHQPMPASLKEALALTDPGYTAGLLVIQLPLEVIWSSTEEGSSPKVEPIPTAVKRTTPANRRYRDELALSEFNHSRFKPSNLAKNRLQRMRGSYK